MRLAAIIEYDGSRFSGWQLQVGTRTVQGVVEEALAQVANASVRVTTAGRTDTGVHACGQVIHFDTETERNAYQWLRGANSNLPDDAVVLWADRVDDEFHARFSATGRYYRYVILNRKVRPTILQHRVTWDHRSLDEVCMQRAADALVGTHDFSAFRSVQCQAKSPIREMRSLQVERRGEYIHVTAYANAFLHHMIRNIAGALMTIGAGEQPVGWVKEVLQSRDRTKGGVTAAPDGLYLTAIEYPEVFKIPRLSPDCGLW